MTLNSWPFLHSKILRIWSSKDSHPGLEEREYSLDGVGVSLAVHVLPLTMVQGYIVVAGKVVVDGEIVMVHFESMCLDHSEL
ncbi:hypothetical protein AKJ41_04985 [candidate division MSBL1 archaeon SCGC-AAA259O05]|uniref:Uncharacterized protein n=1 Tax=candidate division MSBL1 archaeon SCGC-AAA259O05 TaxID=1698271 RepID=A0A133UZV1_9EURY|nr:hypothetical protein AKJ41_04985 [candidate division MSBL1 archaeon SCGC-AAA259O05]